MFFTSKTIILINKGTSASSYTLEQYTNALKQISPVSLSFSNLTTDHDVTFMYTTYENKGSDDVDYSYSSGIYKYNGNFYVIEIGCKLTNKTDKLLESYKDILKAVKLGPVEESQ